MNKVILIGRLTRDPELRNIKYDDSNNYEVSEDEFVFIEKC